MTVVPHGLRVTPLEFGFGAVVTGIDWGDALDCTVGAFLLATCARHGFLVLPNQRLTFAQQRQFGRLFGDVLERSEQPRNSSDAGTPGASDDRRLAPELLLHFDHWMRDGMPALLRYTILYGIDVTSTGGETVLVSTAHAHRMLPTRTKALIAEMTVVDYYDYTAGAADRIGQRVRASMVGPDQPHRTHAITTAHPETAELLLAVSPANTDRILGLSLRKSENLLDNLFQVISAQALRYEHRWSRGDLLIWDNQRAVHGRRPYLLREPRRLRRLSIL